MSKCFSWRWKLLQNFSNSEGHPQFLFQVLEEKYPSGAVSLGSLPSWPASCCGESRHPSTQPTAWRQGSRGKSLQHGGHLYFGMLFKRWETFSHQNGWGYDDACSIWMRFSNWDGAGRCAPGERANDGTCCKTVELRPRSPSFVFSRMRSEGVLFYW